MSSPVHVDNKKKNILILGKAPAPGLEHTLTAEKMYSISFTVIGKSFVEAFIIMEQMIVVNNTCLLMVEKLINLKQKFLRL